jgi:hypothetical protein
LFTLPPSGVLRLSHESLNSFCGMMLWNPYQDAGKYQVSTVGIAWFHWMFRFFSSGGYGLSAFLFHTLIYIDPVSLA